MRKNWTTTRNRLLYTSTCAGVLFLTETYFFFSLLRNLSSAATMEGAWGSGALMPNLSPASSMALEVLFPKAPITVPFCLNLGTLSNKLLTPLGVKKQMTSYSLLARMSFTSLLAVRYMKAREKAQLLLLSHPVISLSC